MAHTIEHVNETLRQHMADIGEQWATAYDEILVARGKRKGLLKRSASNLSDNARVLWNAYEDSLCEMRAGQYGFFPNKSYGSTIGALMFCRDPLAKIAYDILQTGIFILACSDPAKLNPKMAELKEIALNQGVETSAESEPVRYDMH
jgi:hypothetical protein